MERSKTIANLSAALVAAQTDIKNMRPEKEGYGYKYVDLADILDAVKPVLKRHKLAVVQLPIGSSDGIGVHTLLVHESGEFVGQDILMPSITMKGMNDAQAAGAVITYSRRYALSAVLGIASDEDVDARPEGSQTHGEAPQGDLKPKRDNILIQLKEAFDNGLYTEEEFETIGAGLMKMRTADALSNFAMRLNKGIRERASK